VPWYGSSFDTQQQLRNNTDQHDLHELGQQLPAAGQMLAPPPQQPKLEQQEPDEKLPPFRGSGYVNLQVALPDNLADAAHKLRGHHDIMSPGMTPMLQNFFSPAALGLFSARGRISNSQLMGFDFDLTSLGELITSRPDISVNPDGPFAAAAAAAAGFGNTRSARPSDNGANLASMLASGGAVEAAPRRGVKRERCSERSIDDDGLLISPGKVARRSEASASGALYGDGNSCWLPGCLGTEV
jgi:hypothetical protein